MKSLGVIIVSMPSGLEQINKKGENEIMSFDQLKEEVLAKRPNLATLLKKRGKMALGVYAQSFYERTADNMHQLHRERLPSFISAFGAKTRKLFGDDVAQMAIKRFERYPFVTTANHHGLCTHPILMNSDLVFGLNEVMSNPTGCIPVLASGNIPANNATYPQGFLHWAGGKEKKFPIFSNKKKATLMYCLSRLGRVEIEETLKKLMAAKRAGNISNFSVFMEMISRMWDDEMIKNSNFSDQVSIMNAKNWKRFFSFSVPKLISLEMEAVTIPLLCDLFGKDNFISNSIFDPAWREKILRAFYNIPGCWGEKEGKDGKERIGSEFFYGIDKQGKAFQLQVDNNGEKLVNENGFELEIKPKAISKALKKRQIIPTLWVQFGVIHFYQGIQVYGGFMQVDYIARMTKAWKECLNEFGADEDLEAISSMPGSGFCAGPITRFVKEDTVRKAYLADWLKRPLTPQDIETIAAQTLENTLLPGLPDMYRIIFGKKDANPELLKVSEKDVVERFLSELIFD